MWPVQDEGLRSAVGARLEQQRVDALTKRLMEQEVRCKSTTAAVLTVDTLLCQYFTVVLDVYCGVHTFLQCCLSAHAPAPSWVPALRRGFPAYRLRRGTCALTPRSGPGNGASQRAKLLLRTSRGQWAQPPGRAG